MFNIEAVQAAIRDANLDGWLMADFRGANVLAGRVLGLAEAHRSRRWCYFVPADGPAQKLVHRIESAALDTLPGDKTVYLRWQEYEAGLQTMLGNAKRVAMEYSPRNAIPYIARVDAGTVELVQSCGVEVVSSGDLIQLFEATWTDEQWKLHQRAAKLLDESFGMAWAAIAEHIRDRGYSTELDIQALIMKFFQEHDAVTDHPPIVGVGPHSGDPHYAPDVTSNTRIEPGSFVLIDQWAKIDQPGAVFADFTRVGYVGDDVPDEINKVFKIVIAGRDASIDKVKRAFAAEESLQGWMVDAVCRDVIDKAGYGEFFTHRTGHNIGLETHGNGCHMDSLETKEERSVMPRTCFSVEPGIYLPEFGVRSEINVYVDENKQVHVTGNPQTEIRRILV